MSVNNYSLQLRVLKNDVILMKREKNSRTVTCYILTDVPDKKMTYVTRDDPLRADMVKELKKCGAASLYSAIIAAKGKKIKFTWAGGQRTRKFTVQKHVVNPQ